MDFKTTYSGVNSGVGPSMSIWGDCPQVDIRNDRNVGHYFEDDFIGIPASGTLTTEAGLGQYRAFGDSGASFTDGATHGGALTMGEATDEESLAIATKTAFQLASTLGKMWFEARIKVSSIADAKTDVFVGLMDSTALSNAIPITQTADAMGNINFFGFQRLSSDGDKLDIKYGADGQTHQVLLADAVTLVADTYIKVGWKFDPNAPTARRITFYSDGTPITTYGTGTQMDAVTFPDDVQLGLVLALMNDSGSSPHTATIDWWKCYQLAV